MIHIDQASPPAEFEKLAAEALQRLRETHTAGGYKTQLRYEFDERVWMPFSTQLAEVTFGKCAYCETRLVDQVEINHFRPLMRAEGLAKGDISPDHYWWLAYEWSNLVPTCAHCNRSKRARFPVRNRRAKPFGSLTKEGALLLCPYSDVNPDDHLWFEDHGIVTPLSDQGEVSIQVFDLNRPNLVERRRDRADRVIRALEAAGGRLDPTQRDELAGPHVEFAAVARQLIQRRQHTTTSAGDDVPPEPSAAPSGKEVLSAAVAAADLVSVWIEEVELTDITCIEHLNLQFSEPATGREPWIVLLGSNGVGKSSVLKAIAIALSNEADRARLLPNPSRFVRHGRDTGRIRVRFNDGNQITVVLRRRPNSYKVTGSRPQFGLAGYGSTRLLRRSPTRAFTRATGPTLDNLFDPWTPLADAEPWLADTKHVVSDHFQLLASQVKTLLSIEHEVELSRLRGRLRARVHDELLELPQLSDGYQTILALALDLTMAFGRELEQGFSTENFEGMVLLDELEVHLHPEWKLKVVSDLRSMFPHLQFVVTTHDPLCLRGLETGEIHLLRRDDQGDVVVEQIDVPPGLDADEILTGQWFGLTTTLDGAVERDLLEYQRLRMQGRRPDDPELAPLRQRLSATIGSYAGTSAGGVLLDAASEVAAEQASSGSVRLTKDAVKQRLLEHAQRQPS